jgi:hypothetical protein
VLVSVVVGFDAKDTALRVLIYVRIDGLAFAAFQP